MKLLPRRLTRAQKVLQDCKDKLKKLSESSPSMDSFVVNKKHDRSHYIFYMQLHLIWMTLNNGSLRRRRNYQVKVSVFMAMSKLVSYITRTEVPCPPDWKEQYLNLLQAFTNIRCLL